VCAIEYNQRIASNRKYKNYHIESGIIDVLDLWSKLLADEPKYKTGNETAGHQQKLFEAFQNIVHLLRISSMFRTSYILVIAEATSSSGSTLCVCV